MLQATFPLADDVFAFARAPADPPARAQPLPKARHGVDVTLQALTKSFSGRRVLDGVGLELKAGEFVAIVGRSGCGKSTLLRAIAGLDGIDGGKVTIGTVDAAANTPVPLRMMFQDARLLPWKTVLQNVALGLKDGRQAAANALAAVGLADRADAWPAQLSGGQRQRVALARALVHEPSLLLLDEPLGALDALTRIEMQQLIESLWRQRGFTAVLVTHDVQEAVALADRVLLIEEGRITLDLAIDLPRPRTRGNPMFAALEEQLLNRLLNPVPASRTR
ncbi:sulfonate transport system ATP-binding protein [Pseudoduganella lurida]|uniref:Sulfonate transport system ATP-binding protein n=1 Tax=Pseudoduganella lurida TaxID=1036180 RepID=A0A562RF24_9BURK|nr:ATP-binding cassette domain-containing protein [Pseudoduganella lurida]TWI67652.1 sulfonate transport system ATP-binding protein [Pseudoduganella lurida]